MKPEDQLSQSTEKALRGPLPDAAAGPGFETRLLACLDGPAARPWWTAPRLAFACALVVAAVVASGILIPDRSKPVSQVEPDRTEPVAKPVYTVENLPNPLAEETKALTDAASRTGRFLIGFLPSVPEENGAL